MTLELIRNKILNLLDNIEKILRNYKYVLGLEEKDLPKKITELNKSLKEYIIILTSSFKLLKLPEEEFRGIFEQIPVKTSINEINPLLLKRITEIGNLITKIRNLSLLIIGKTSANNANYNSNPNEKRA